MRPLAALALLFIAAPAVAHDGSQHSPGWALGLWVTAPLAAGAILYAGGLMRLWKRSDLGRASLRRDAALFGLGWLTLAGALVSPLHEAGETSFTMHMIEHELIMLVAALLIVAGRPGAVFLWALPSAMRRMAGSAARVRAWRRLGDPIVATALQAAAICAWHAPALFDRALRSEGWHVAQHLSFVATALLFWWAMTNGSAGRNGYGVSAMCLFVTSLIGGALGALMSFSASPWYEGYAALGMTPSGLTPAEDQQLAGLIMWIPGGTVHLAAAAFFVFKWLRAEEARHVLPAE
ncbi:MAG TPA: cytochrome c oxidase assembly protein [Allosphingosinicella sp.]|nr:cytochrome c oxidase assembly protein [Allosphingosinicella sp.]